MRRRGPDSYFTEQDFHSLRDLFDPCEKIIARALLDINEPFFHDCDTSRYLDFWLPRRDLYIEVKRFHSPRVSEQLKRGDNRIIVAQGMPAVQMLAELIYGWGLTLHPHPRED